MAFQSEVGSGSQRATSRFDWLNKRVLFMCSQHVATVVINNGGTGGTYAIGDLVTLSHASAHFDAVFEVLTVSAGAILTMRINNSGAFALQGASAIVNAGGSLYKVDDILEVQGGTSRCPMKFKVATLSGSAVATVTLFEGGGVYSAAPGLTGAVTVGVGNDDGTSSFAGDDLCTLDLTMQALITPLTAIAVTGGGGTGATVDITLAETGWAVDSRNTNNNTINGIANEKQVVLKGDATGLTNKPFIVYATFTETISGSVDHGGIANMGLIAHNPAITLTANTPRTLGIASETAMDITGAFSMMLPDTGAGFGTVDLWMNADDVHFREIAQIDAAAGSADNSIYGHHYAGFLDRVGTETENPYPLYIFGSNRDPTTAANVNSANNTGLAEQRGGSNGQSFIYNSLTGLFVQVRNADGLVNPGVEPFMVAPGGLLDLNDGTTDADYIVRDVHENERSIAFFGQSTGTDAFDRKIFNHEARAVPHRLMRWVPGTVDVPFLWPLTIATKTTATAQATDRVLGNIKGCFFIPSDNGSGSRITNFSEDFVSIGGVGGDRYLAFHNTTENDPNQYIAFFMDV